MIQDDKASKLYKRAMKNRVFVNREVNLEHIKYFGFDMDYTLAVYKSPIFESLSYQLAVDRLIAIGYPEEIRKLKYDPTYPIRGLFCDKINGNLLKIDSFGTIVNAMHARKKLSDEMVSTIYPSGKIHDKDIGNRFYLLDTLFHLPEACIFCDLVEFFTSNSEIKIGMSEELSELQRICASSPREKVQEMISYTDLLHDIRETIDYIHKSGTLKDIVVKDIEKYIIKDPKLVTLLRVLKSNDRKAFLLTNSEYYYTNTVMNYMLGDFYDSEYPTWRHFFDIIMVGARKPEWFEEGTTLREVNLDTGLLLMSKEQTKYVYGKVYNGGSLEKFEKMTGAKGHEVLYVGDHIFGDIIKSKKHKSSWNCLLVVPELVHERDIWNNNQDKYRELLRLQAIESEIYYGLEATATEKPDTSELDEKIKEASIELDKSYNQFFGSLFRSGSKQSFFSYQTQRFADLYSSTHLNLLNYPMFYRFSPVEAHLPHEKDPFREYTEDESE